MSKGTTENTKELAKKFADLIGPTDPKIDREVREQLITARVGLLLKSSFFGNLATRLKLVNELVDVNLFSVFVQIVIDLF